MKVEEIEENIKRRWDGGDEMEGGRKTRRVRKSERGRGGERREGGIGEGGRGSVRLSGCLGVLVSRG